VPRVPFRWIDPATTKVRPLMARWYAPAFVIGILLGWWNLKRLSRHRSSFVSTDPVN